MEKCHCNEECECKECECTEEEKCHEECTCHECNCDDNCECEECECDDCKCEENSKLNKKEEKKKNKDKLKKLEEKNKELEDSLLRSKAEFINYRKRLEEEQRRLMKYCNEDLIKQLLPILDNFERAIKMDDDNLNDEVSKFLSGVKMIYCNFNNILKENGVVEIDGANKPFDPVYHEAIMTDKKEGVEPGMVTEVLQKGYILKEKVIRPAMVKVSE